MDSRHNTVDRFRQRALIGAALLAMLCAVAAGGLWHYDSPGTEAACPVCQVAHMPVTSPVVPPVLLVCAQLRCAHRKAARFDIRLLKSLSHPLGPLPAKSNLATTDTFSGRHRAPTGLLLYISFSPRAWGCAQALHIQRETLCSEENFDWHLSQ